MAKNTNTNCKVCNHSLRLEIEILRITENKTWREIQDYVSDNTPDEPLSHSTIARHFEKHVDTKREVQIRYLAEKRKIANGEEPDPQDEVGVKLKELRHLDSSIKEAHDLVKAAGMEVRRQLSIRIPKQVKLKDGDGKDTGKVMQYDKVEVSHAVVQLYKSASEELRQTAKTKMELLGIDNKTKNTNDAVSTLVDAIMKVEDDEDE